MHVREFLDSRVRHCVAATTNSQALCALVFLYRHVLEQSLGWLESLERPKRPSRIPVVLTRTEVERVLAAMRGSTGLMAL